MWNALGSVPKLRQNGSVHMIAGLQHPNCMHDELHSMGDLREPGDLHIIIITSPHNVMFADQRAGCDRVLHLHGTISTQN